ncbi:MAG: DUF983 domain-containing protein [Pseudomonadota bacterium]
MLRGLRNRCPNCGEGAVLHSYLKVSDRCANCGEALGHARADDGPAYLTILVVGKILIPIIGILYTGYDPNPIVITVIFLMIALVMSLWLLPKFKGLIIGIQWANYMHGFSKHSK